MVNTEIAKQFIGLSGVRALPLGVTAELKEAVKNILTWVLVIFCILPLGYTSPLSYENYITVTPPP